MFGSKEPTKLSFEIACVCLRIWMLQSIARLGETFRGSTGTALCFENMLLVTWILKFLGLETITESNRDHGGSGRAGCACAVCSLRDGSFWHGQCRPTEFEFDFQLSFEFP